MSGFLTDGQGGGGYGYNYLPEMQGMTSMMQRQFGNQMNQQMAGYNNQAGRSNLQSSGGFLAGRAQLGAKAAQGTQDIATQNMYKNAVYAMQDRRIKEQQAFQQQQQANAFRNQMDMYNLQQQQGQQNALMGGLGSIAGMFLNPVLGGVAGKLGGMINPQPDYMKQLMGMFMNNGQSSGVGGNSPAVPNNATGYNSNGVQSYMW